MNRRNHECSGGNNSLPTYTQFNTTSPTTAAVERQRIVMEEGESSAAATSNIA